MQLLYRITMAVFTVLAIVIEFKINKNDKPVKYSLAVCLVLALGAALFMDFNISIFGSFNTLLMGIGITMIWLIIMYFILKRTFAALIRPKKKTPVFSIPKDVDTTPNIKVHKDMSIQQIIEYAQIGKNRKRALELIDNVLNGESKRPSVEEFEKLIELKEDLSR